MFRSLPLPRSRAACAVLAGTLALVGCLHKNEKSHHVIVLLVDTSTSTDDARVQENYRNAVRTVLDAFATEGDKGRLAGDEALIAVDAISARSLTQSMLDETTLPKRDFNTNALRFRREMEAARQEVFDNANALIRAPRAERGTSIIDAVGNAADYFAYHHDGAQLSLILLSDMIEESRHLKFTRDVLTEEGTDAKVRQLGEQELVPVLEDVVVFVAGAGATANPRISEERVQAIERFWERFFEEAGADFSSARYRATLIDFP
jgi:hypothetical protein